ncbi:MAG: ATP-binding cassette domain-containing protein [Gemmatimonadota bacterium]
MAPLLSAEAVVKRFDAAPALDGVTLAVERAECVALVGESGAGKSTLLRCFNRLVEPDGGAVSVRGRDVRDTDPILLRRGIGYVPQEGGLLPHWRIARNVGVVPWLAGDPAADRLARDALQLVGLEPERYTERWPRELSGGQRQRAAIARALAARPDVVLLDEPFGALDAITRAELQTTFRQLQRELGLTAVLVTHDLREALELGDRVVVMRAGRIEQAAAPAALLGEPATAYVAELLARARVRGP